ncbi:MAG TPA: hypothetical protein VLA45_15455 [Paracoccaceae bacterium]|nr:hypothetical protein [Paracoccaceae bacterium]
MTALISSLALGVGMGVSRPLVAKSLLLAWLALLAMLVGPMLLMPDNTGDLVLGSAALTLVGLPVSLGLGWLSGLGVARLARRRA